MLDPVRDENEGTYRGGAKTLVRQYRVQKVAEGNLFRLELESKVMLS